MVHRTMPRAFIVNNECLGDLESSDIFVIIIAKRLAPCSYYFRTHLFYGFRNHSSTSSTQC